MDCPHLLLTNKKRGWNGEAAMIAELARGFAKRGYRVTLASNPKATIIDKLVDSGVEILPLTLLKEMPQTLWTLTNDMRRLAKYIREQKVRLVHSHASFDTWTSALAIRRHRLRVPLIRTKHNLKFIRTNWTNRWYYGKAINHFIAPSRAIEEVLKRSNIVPNDKINYIPNGIAIDKIEVYKDGKAKARKELKIPAEAEVIVYVSRLTRRKDPETLVRAVLQVGKIRRNIRLLVVGGGDESLREELEKISCTSPVVEFWGHRNDVPLILAAADIFVLPSLTEAFGLAPLEAMLQRVATIVSDAEGFRDYMEDGRNGLVFPKGDIAALAHALERLLCDPELRNRISVAGEQTVRDRFYAQRMVDDVEELYRRVLFITPTNGLYQSASDPTACQ
jgi:glycosyltransferase involved in cell wall biosynthesis